MASLPIHPDHPDFLDLAREGRIVAYFGYGSLVNRDTLRTRFLAIRRAKASGWQRFWLPRPDVGIALLSARPDPEGAIDGVVVYDLADDLASVDEREADYRRQTVPPAVLAVEAAPAVDLPIFIYEAVRPGETAADAASAILQSYLDAVMQGFLAVHGDEGLRRFVFDTQGFETAVIRDRMKPRYPRAVTLRDGEASRFDRLLLDRGVRFQDE